MSLPLLLDPESRRAFLEDRQKVLGSSDIGPVCGLDGYRDAIDIYHDKTRPVEVDSEANIHLLRGVLLEPIAGELYKTITGKKIRRMGQRIHPDNRWAGVHADFQILADNGSGTGALEVKAPGVGTFSRILEMGLPDSYITQLQWQLYVTGYSWGEYAVVNLEHKDGPLLTIPVERDDDLIGEMVARGEKFWHHVEERKPLNPLEWIQQEPLPIPSHDHTMHYVDPADHPELVKMLELDREKKRINKEWEAQRDLVRPLIDAEGWTRLHVRGFGKINYGHREGRKWPNEKRLYAARPLDRDLVRGAFADEGIPISEDGLTLLELDLATVMNVTDSHRHFQCWPAKIEE